jgi:hypothetical protein
VIRPDHAEEIRRSLTDPVRIARALGMLEGAKPQASGVTVRCPWHDDGTPSCSLTIGTHGTLRAKCFACGAAGDVLALVAVRYGLDCRRDFPAVLLATAEVGGLHQLADELRGTAERVERPLPPLPEPAPARDYPPTAEVLALWQAALPVADIEPCAVALGLRGLFPGPELARALAGTLPRWARYQGRSWLESGHRVALPVYDPAGELRSVRAWQIQRDADGPRRLPPAGHRASELVLANAGAVTVLRAPAAPVRLLIAEGESDYLSLCERYPGAAVLGVFSGGWTPGFAARIPFGSEVTVRTDSDAAGDRYAEQIRQTLVGRAIVRRAA